MTSFDAVAVYALEYMAARNAQVDHEPDAADRVLRARVAMADALVAAGWRPDERRAVQLEVDRRLLDEVRGAVESGLAERLPVQSAAPESQPAASS